MVDWVNMWPVKDKGEKQLDLMWQFLQFGHQISNIKALKENCEALRHLMMQKTAGQRENRKGDIPIEDLQTIINCIVIESMCLYLSGDLDKLEEFSACEEGEGKDGQGKREGCVKDC